MVVRMFRLLAEYVNKGKAREKWEPKRGRSFVYGESIVPASKSCHGIQPLPFLKELSVTIRV